MYYPGDDLFTPHDRPKGLPLENQTCAFETGEDPLCACGGENCMFAGQLVRDFHGETEKDGMAKPAILFMGLF